MLLRQLNIYTAGGLVHEDVREYNLLTNEAGDVKLIDFDWAGKAGTVRYPHNLNDGVEWPARSNDKIHYTHDAFMLGKIESK